MVNIAPFQPLEGEPDDVGRAEIIRTRALGALSMALEMLKRPNARQMTPRQEGAIKDLFLQRDAAFWVANESCGASARAWLLAALAISIYHL